MGQIVEDSDVPDSYIQYLRGKWMIILCCFEVIQTVVNPW